MIKAANIVRNLNQHAVCRHWAVLRVPSFLKGGSGLKAFRVCLQEQNSLPELPIS